MSQEITADQIKQFQADFNNVPQSGVVKRAVMNSGILATSENTDSKIAMDPVFSIDLKTGKVANQKQSGRCWMFAALNTMRHSIQAEYKIKDFELSQNYTFFWDKFEKSNYFYENVLKTADKPTSDRKVAWLMQTPQGDGGQWDMLTSLIQKYGIVPQTVMPETYNSSKSNEFNTVLNLKLRKDAVTLRKMVKDGAADGEIAKTKAGMLNDIYRMLTYSFGEPPATFDWEYRDDEGNFHADRGLTPQSYFKKYIGWNIDDYQSVINAPTADKPYNHIYTVEMLGNVVGGRQIRHLNLEIDAFKQATIKQLEAGESVWFGCDVGQSSDRQLGIMDTKIYDKNALFGVDFNMTKADRLDYSESLMTHAMVITGVDLVDGQPTKWKVENSWGDKPGKDGFFVMSDDWFNEYMYQVVVNKKYLPESVKSVLNEEPAVLEPWDPMGSLA